VHCSCPFDFSVQDTLKAEREIIVKSILCFGDSLTWGYNAETGQRYPYHLRWTGVMALALGEEFMVIEEGLNGRTTVWDDPVENVKSGLSYLPTCLQSHKPIDLVILMLGTNDLKARFSLTPYDIAAGVSNLVQMILGSQSSYEENPPGILLVVPPPVDPDELDEMFKGAREKSFALPKYYARVAEEFGCALLDSGKILSVDPLDGVHLDLNAHRTLGTALAEKAFSLLRA
jgi:lysophospholipase L1-like esterase